MKILITGISGLLGPYIAQAFINSDFKISYLVGVYNSNKPTYNDINLKLIDLTDFNSLNKLKNNFDIIIHCAAATNVNRCEIDSDYAYKGNVLMTKNIIDFASINKSRLIFISTEAVFYNIKDAFEENIPNPKTIYGLTKYEAEKLVLNYQNSLILRTTIFGENLNNSDKLFEHVYNNLNHNISVNAIADNLFNPITTIEFSNILINLIKKNASGIYHINSDEVLSRFDLYNLIAENFKLDKSLINPISTKDLSLDVKRSVFTYLNNNKIKTFLNLNHISLLEQIKNIGDYKKNG